MCWRQCRLKLQRRLQPVPELTRYLLMLSGGGREMRGPVGSHVKTCGGSRRNDVMGSQPQCATGAWACKLGIPWPGKS